MKHNNLLIVADCERDADLLYAVGLSIPDPFIYLRLKGRQFIVLSDQELSRARRAVRDCRVLSLSAYHRRLKNSKNHTVQVADVIQAVMREQRVKKLTVPPSFPLGLAQDLRNLKVKIKLHEGPVFPDRQFKTTTEIKKISAALTMAEVGLAEGLLALRNAKVSRDRHLTYRNAPLTSEKLRAIIDTAILSAGGDPSNTIVAGGRQACDPHEPGHGPLRANEPIVIDVFPRSRKTGYHADLTRTVVKGRASEEVRKIYATVQRAQELAFAQLKPKTAARSLHNSILRFFEKEGYPIRRRNGRVEGFIHCTGHGLGLELHERPRINGESTDRLLSGHVLTLEPALYYRGTGGVRLEDVVHLTAKGPRNLTQFEKTLEL